jgi:hypothetical protein
LPGFTAAELTTFRIAVCIEAGVARAGRTRTAAPQPAARTLAAFRMSRRDLRPSCPCIVFDHPEP